MKESKFTEECVIRISEHRGKLPVFNYTDKDIELPWRRLPGMPVQIKETPTPHIYNIENNDSGRKRLLEENIGTSQIDRETRILVEEIIFNYSDIFCLPGDPLPPTTGLPHRVQIPPEVLGPG